MTHPQSNPPPASRFRAMILAFACILAGFASWTLAAEILRPKGIDFTTDAHSAASMFKHRDAAVKAAQFGLVRGDLWSEAAFAYGNLLLSEVRSPSRPEGTLVAQTQAVTELAITYAPHDSRLWLLLAATYFEVDRLNERAAASLRMSYYTGSNNLAVLPTRLLLATQSHALRDDDFQELVRHDIEIAIARKGQFSPAIVAAYNNASASGRQIFEKALGATDPGMLESMRSRTENR